MRFLLIIFTSLIFLISPAHAKDKVLDIKEVTSPGGIKAWLVEDHSVPVIAMKFAFNGAGASMDPADKQGLSRLLSNTLDEGAGELDSEAFQKKLRDLSVDLSFSNGRDHFNGNLKTLTKNKTQAFELLKLALMQPRFDEEPVERMRKANQSRLRSSLSDPEWIAARLLNDKAFEGHVYAQNSGGTISGFDNITTSDLRNFHQTYLGKNILHVAVAGDITEEELKANLDSLFGDLPNVFMPKPEDLNIQNQGKIFLYKSDIPQTIIEMMQPGVGRKDPDYQKAQVMNFVLGSSGFGSRLTEEIREKRGLTYGIYSYFYNLDHVHGLSVTTSTENGNVPEMLSLIEQEWSKIKNAPISGQELDSARAYLIGSLPLTLTSTDRIASLLLSLQLDDLAIDYLDQRKLGIQTTSIEDVQRVAGELLNFEQFVTVLIGQPAGLEALGGTEILDKIPNVE